jgi:eukaryotic-like serine/threonine-protein kinase
VADARTTRAREIFADALRRDPQERYDFIDQACAGQPALRAEVAALLEAHIAGGQPTEGGQAGVPPVHQAAKTPPNPSGRAIGPYVIRGELGRGGMGVVYLADDTRLLRQVALKVLSPDIGRDHRGRERLRREARAAAGLSHPGIATVFALEEIGEELYMVCEYVAGQSLRKLLGSGPMPIDQVLDVGAQIARTLAVAHAAGVVHRDLKPENIIRTPAGVVKVLDFGLARVEGLTTLTNAGIVLGTPAYMAPEQALGQPVDFRTDLFALGVILYEMAAGTNPFVARSVTATMMRIVETEAPALSQARAGSPLELDRIVALCLRKDPRERYDSTQTLADDLDRLSAEATPGRRLPADTGGAETTPSAGGGGWTPLGWWRFHQATVAAAYVLMLYPVWRARVWLSEPWSMIFLLWTLACTAAAVSLRLHLLFMARFYLDDLAEQHAHTQGWIRLSDTGLSAGLLVGAIAIGSAHPEFAMLLVGVATAALVGALVIEPATTRAAFRRSGIVPVAPWKRA